MNEIGLAVMFIIYISVTLAIYKETKGDIKDFSLKSKVVCLGLWPVIILVWIIAEYVHSLGKD